MEEDYKIVNNFTNGAKDHLYFIKGPNENAQNYDYIENLN